MSENGTCLMASRWDRLQDGSRRISYMLQDCEDIRPTRITQVPDSIIAISPKIQPPCSRIQGHALAVGIQGHRRRTLHSRLTDMLTIGVSYRVLAKLTRKSMSRPSKHIGTRSMSAWISKVR